MASLAQGSFVVPRSPHPAEASVPTICRLWQVTQVRFAGLPRPTVLIWVTSRIQNGRLKNTSEPRITEARKRARASPAAADFAFQAAKDLNAGVPKLSPRTPLGESLRFCAPRAGGAPSAAKSSPHRSV